MPWLCCHRTPKSKREDQYKVGDLSAKCFPPHSLASSVQVTDEAEESPPMDVDEAAPAADTFSWDRRPKMDPDQYRIHDLDGATEVRRGGAGQPMAIESCKVRHASY
ncbi:hypothetical protein Q1695_005264 [Nippostrongylus brasiliensis]|nr:hypothetical protein Q1695_005264 [Nippostrongylus brasiliensis]